MRSPLRVFLGLLLGAFLGYVCRRSPLPLLHQIPTLIDPLARLFINAIRVCVIPLITTSLIAGCATTNSAKLGRLAGRSLTIILFYLVASAVFAGAIAAPLFHYLSKVLGPGSVAAETFSIPSVAAPTFGSFLVDLVPGNIFKAAEDGALLPLVLFSVAFGMAISHLADSERVLLTRFFRALANGFTFLIDRILTTAPIGVFFLSIGLAASVRADGASLLAGYIVAMWLSPQCSWLSSCPECRDLQFIECARVYSSERSGASDCFYFALLARRAACCLQSGAGEPSASG